MEEKAKIESNMKTVQETIAREQEAARIATEERAKAEATAKAEQEALAKAQAEIAEKQKQEKASKPAEPVAKIQKHSLSLIRNQLKVEKNFT